MNMKGFSFFDKEENSLKDWALSYVKATKGEIGSQMEGDRDYPFLVINREPDFWWELPEGLREVSENTGITNCTVAGPYCLDTDWLPENWGHECYVYQNYDEGEVDSGVQYSEGEDIKYVALRMNEYLGHLESGTAPKYKSGVNGLSPRQFAELIAYLSKEVDESLDITKNDLECCNFILSPDLETMLDELVYDEGIEEIDQLAEKLVEKLGDFVDGLANAIDEDILCFFFE